MEKGKDSVDYAVFLQKRLPCKGSQQKIHPHGEDKNKYDKAAGLISPSS